MGCDIHAFVEWRRDESLPTISPWESLTIGQWDLWRNYDLFGLMAGVRGVADPVVASRGVPRDLSGPAAKAYRYWEDDCHGGSWLGLDEFSEVLRRYHLIWPDRKVTEYACAHAAMQAAEGQGYQARLVFWFDN